MSGICGVVNGNDQPLYAQSLGPILSAMSDWGPDGIEQWQAEAVAFGHLMLHHTPESLAEVLPFHCHDSNLTITATARLDNRDDLFGQLAIPRGEHQHMPDSQVILRAYKKWGEDCPKHLLGDWSFAIWNAKQKTLFLARDHHGNTGLYFHQSLNTFVFASSLNGILAHPDVPQRCDRYRLAQFLISWPDHGNSTMYEEIQRLPPAHSMTVRQGHVRVRRYWSLEDTPQKRDVSDEECVEGFLDVYTEAVRCRMRSVRPVAVTLSGGLDSGSVTALAARELQSEGKRLPAFSSVPIHDVTNTVASNRFGDETPYVEAARQHFKNVDVHYIHAKHTSPLQGMRRILELTAEPNHASANHYWIVALQQAAREQNIGTLLTGQGGNGTVSWTGEGNLPRLFRQGRWLALSREFRADQKLSPNAIHRAMWSQVIQPALPRHWRSRIQKWRRGVTPWKTYSAINPEFAQQIQLSQRIDEQGHDPVFGKSHDTRETRFRIIKPGRNHVGCFWHENGAGHGLEVRDPTFDKRVMEYCLSMPDNQYLRNGVDRYLIRRAMQDLLPPKVQWNRKRGRQAADIAQRLQDCQPEMQEALDEISSLDTAQEILDIPKMRSALAQVVDKDHAATVQSGAVLARGLMAGLFLLRFEQS